MSSRSAKVTTDVSVREVRVLYSDNGKPQVATAVLDVRFPGDVHPRENLEVHVKTLNTDMGVFCATLRDYLIDHLKGDHEQPRD
jgi:hypothetical protein